VEYGTRTKKEIKVNEKISARYQEYREQNPNGELVWRALNELIWCEIDRELEFICFMEPESGHIVDHLVHRHFPEGHPTHPGKIKSHMEEKNWTSDHMQYFDECVQQLKEAKNEEKTH
jgi:hypothetical protein